MNTRPNLFISLWSRWCFNYPTLGDLYKYATYAAILKRDGLVVDDSQPGQISCKLNSSEKHRRTGSSQVEKACAGI
jgi:hypothetical protein